MSKKILITGVGSGFGYLTLKSLLEDGHQVVGTVLSLDEKNSKELQDAGAYLVQMDVTNEDQVNKGVQEAIDHLDGLDVVINNAGVGILGMQENCTVDDMKDLFDVNVFGVQRVIRAVLPQFRKQGNGLILYMSSLLGRLILPFHGVYSSSKWALEAMAESYRTELSAFGIESCIIEPGAFPTTFMDHMKSPSDTSRDLQYGDYIHAPKMMFDRMNKALEANENQRPQKVADAIVNLINLPYGEKPLRTTIDFLGMGDAVHQFNEVHGKITHGVYANLGTDGMLSVKKTKDKK